MQDPANPRPPPKIPGYRIEGVVGRGATGVVYRARQISVDRVVALKVLHAELVGAPRAEHRLQREARTTARLAHPNIISAIDMGEIDGVWWYAMELIDGVSLLDRIREKRLTEREAVRMFIPLCDALQHAFERGVVHRDIKPANILVDRAGRALLVDLGLAVADDDPLLTKSGATLGTPHYISPEQARDPSSADVQSDLWSLGATLYHAVCGRPPFNGESVAEILSAVLYARVPDPAAIAPELSNGFVLVLRKCLTRDRARRYATPAELAADLERLRERRAPLVKRGALEPLERDHRLAKRLAVAALVLVVLFAAWRYVRIGPEPRLAAETEQKAQALAPLDRLEQESAGESPLLADLLAQAERMRVASVLSPEDRLRVDVVRTRIYERLEGEIWNFKKGFEERLSRMLEAAEFERADALIDTELARELKGRLGAAPLPERMREDVALFAASSKTKVRESRERAERSVSSGLQRHYVEKILPRVDELQATQHWREARALLTTQASEWIAEAAVDPRAHPPAVYERALSSLRAVLAERREALDRAWQAVDAELAAWVDARVRTLETELSERLTQDAPRALRTSFDAELARRKLSLDDMPLGLLHLGHEELEKGAQSLAALERSLGEADARLRLNVLEEEEAPLWKERRYGEIAAALAQETAGEWNDSVRSEVELRLREARALEGVLERAAQGVRAHDGKNLDLRVGSIVLSGRITAGSDPLERGFLMTLRGGKTYTLSLRAASDAPSESAGPDSVRASPLGSEAIETLAGLAPSGTTPEATRERLLLALFRFREGALGTDEGARAAQAVLNAGPLPRDDALLADLESRVALTLSTTERAEGERRERALSMLYLLRREMALAKRPESQRRRVEELLTGYADVLSANELLDLRRMRDELFMEARPATREDIEAAFHPDSLELVGASRVRLRFAFTHQTAGAFDLGSWNPNGIGLVAARFAKSDQDLLSRPGPCLVLRDPLRPQGDTIDVRLKIEQPADSPPELLFVSLCGFHFALTGAKDGERPRCVIDTGTAEDVLAEARRRGGKEWFGLERGATAEIRFIVNRTRGTASVEVDGRKIADAQRLAPRDDPASTSLCIRSWEPVQLLEATIELAHR